MAIPWEADKLKKYVNLFLLDSEYKNTPIYLAL